MKRRWPERPAVKKLADAGRKRTRRQDARRAKVPKLGLFFVVNGKPFVDGIPWTENLSVAGLRTSAVGHPEYWEQLQRVGAAPRDVPYEDVPRGRANYLDATGRFTLFADRCIIRNRRLVSRIMSRLSLPKTTKVLLDSHYRCAACIGRVPTRKQERVDWDF
jgi:hypothetical protein